MQGNRDTSYILEYKVRETHHMRMQGKRDTKYEYAR